MRNYTINDLPQFSKWPEILLSAERNRHEHDLDDIHREFEVEKWATLLQEIEKSEKELSIKFVDSIAVDNESEVLAFQNDQLELTSIKNIQNTYAELIAETILPYLSECSAIVDLGCGFGSIILKLAKKASFKNIPLYAADYSKSGIEIVKLVAKAENLNIKTGHCNFLDKDILKFEVPQNALFFTSYSIFYQKQFPDDFVKNLIQYNPCRVINFEPCYEHYHTSSLWGLLSRKYVEYNQYNLNILSYLKNCETHGLINIENIKPLVHGINPLLIASIFNWKPVKSDQ